MRGWVDGWTDGRTDGWMDLRLGEQSKEWVTHSRLHGVTIDNKLSCSRHILEVKKTFANKLNLIKRRVSPKAHACSLVF